MFVRVIATLAARQGVREESAGLRRRPQLRRGLGAVDPANAVVVQVLARHGAVHDHVVEALVESLGGELQSRVPISCSTPRL